MDQQAIAKKRRDKGFTLIELLIVIAILGILSTIVVLSVRGIQDRGETSACKSDIKTLQTAYEAALAQGTITFDPADSDVGPELKAANFLNDESEWHVISAAGVVGLKTGSSCPDPAA